jgi:hypothetical protein
VCFCFLIVLPRSLTGCHLLERLTALASFFSRSLSLSLALWVTLLSLVSPFSSWDSVTGHSPFFFWFNKSPCSAFSPFLGFPRRLLFALFALAALAWTVSFWLEF